MSQRALFHFLATCVLATWMTAIGLGGAINNAFAASEASAWDRSLQSSVRLVGARALQKGSEQIYRAGIEIMLRPGWKTYWRYPGDSGVPPSFNFSKSENVSSVAVLFPAPMRFPDGAGGHSIGYSDRIVLPVHAIAKDASKPVTLRLMLDYAVCEKVCLPVEARLEVVLTGKETTFDGAVGVAESRVPERTRLGAGQPLSIRSVRRETVSGKRRIVVDVAAPPGTASNLFAEGPGLQWALPLPEPVPGAPAGQQRFVFDLAGLPPGVTEHGAVLRLTAVAGERAIEIEFRLD